LRDVLGRRPTLSEFYRSGSSVQAMRQQHGSWFELVRSHGRPRAGSGHRALLQGSGLLREIEVTAMTKSFKMVTAGGLLELDGLRDPPSLGARWRNVPGKS
jgi:hypothetical protein